MEQDTIINVKVTAQEIGTICEKMRVVIQDEHPYAVIMACITVALVMNNPKLTLDQIVEGVQKTSQFMALYTSGLDVGPVPDSKVN